MTLLTMYTTVTRLTNGHIRYLTVSASILTTSLTGFTTICSVSISLTSAFRNHKNTPLANQYQDTDF